MAWHGVAWRRCTARSAAARVGAAASVDACLLACRACRACSTTPSPASRALQASGEPLFYEGEASGPHAEHVITEDDDEVGQGRAGVVGVGGSSVAGPAPTPAHPLSHFWLLVSFLRQPRPIQVVAMIKELLETRIRPAVQVRAGGCRCRCYAGRGALPGHGTTAECCATSGHPFPCQPAMLCRTPPGSPPCPPAAGGRRRHRVPHLGPRHRAGHAQDDGRMQVGGGVAGRGAGGGPCAPHARLLGFPPHPAAPARARAAAAPRRRSR